MSNITVYVDDTEGESLCFFDMKISEVVTFLELIREFGFLYSGDEYLYSRAIMRPSGFNIIVSRDS